MNLQTKKSLFYVFLGGIATSAMDAFAVGPTLLAYASFFGAGNLAFGILGAIPHIGNLIHLFVAWLIEKKISVQAISFWSSFLSRPFYLLAALLAFYPESSWAVPLLILFLSLAYLIGCMAGGAWQPWMKMLVPRRINGRFFAFRFKWMMVVKIICFFITSFFLKYIHDVYPQYDIYAYASLLVMAFIIGLYGAWTLKQVQDIPIPTTTGIPFYKKVITSFQNIRFRELVFALSSLSFANSFITPFLTVFMLKRMELSMSNILILTLILQLSYTFTIKKWGVISDRYGPIKTLYFSILLSILILLGFIVLNFYHGAGGLILVSLLHVLLGISTGGIALGINNSSLQYVPKKSANVYLSVNSVSKSFLSALGSVFAGITLSVCVLLEGYFGPVTSQSGWTSFYVIGFLIYLISFIFLRRLQKSILATSSNDN